jgi:hypothetical protein
MKRIGLLKVAPRVQGKIMETEKGCRLLVVEQRGKDTWRGRHKSIYAAIEAGVAGIGVDKILVKRAETYGVTVVMVVMEDIHRIFLTVLSDFLDEQFSQSRDNWQSRQTRVVRYERFHQKYFGPVLQKQKKRLL